MSFFVSGKPLTAWVDLTTSDVTTIYTATKKTVIVSLGFSENEGGTPTLAVWKNDGTTDFYLRGAKAVAAYERVLIDEVLSLDNGDTIKIQSNDATGAFSCTVTYLAPDAGVGGDHH